MAEGKDGKNPSLQKCHGADKRTDLGPPDFLSREHMNFLLFKPFSDGASVTCSGKLPGHRK